MRSNLIFLGLHFMISKCMSTNICVTSQLIRSRPLQGYANSFIAM